MQSYGSKAFVSPFAALFAMIAKLPAFKINKSWQFFI